VLEVVAAVHGVAVEEAAQKAFENTLAALQLNK
jgi:hypothetical protein